MMVPSHNYTPIQCVVRCRSKSFQILIQPAPSVNIPAIRRLGCLLLLFNRFAQLLPDRDAVCQMAEKPLQVRMH